MSTGYCVKCKAKQSVKEGSKTETTMKNGRPMGKGTCEACGTTICVIGGFKD